MSELWWAEAAIPEDRQPDWGASHERINHVTAQDVQSTCLEYLDEISDAALKEMGLRRPASGFSDDDVLRYPQLVGCVGRRLHQDLDQIRALMTAKRSLVCNFTAGGLKIFVHCSGFTSGDPDELCQAWLRLQNLGVFEAGGFLATTAGATL